MSWDLVNLKDMHHHKCQVEGKDKESEHSRHSAPQNSYYTFDLLLFADLYHCHIRNWKRQRSEKDTKEASVAFGQMAVNPLPSSQHLGRNVDAE